MAEKPLAIDYSHLAPTTEIRILTLERGSDTDPITCALRGATRGEEEYHALSYEWGDESEDDPSITVNSHHVQIRRNLYEALKSIRNPSEDLQLWVDAICINQANIEEKNHQVAMMGETFANATGVIAWLGPARDGSDTAMDWMADKTKLRENLLRCEKDSSEGEAVVSLCHRSYWRRVWIIQELYLSRSYVVRCGTKCVPSDAFEDSLASLNDSDLYNSKDLANNPADHHGRARMFRDGAPQFNILRRWISMCVLGKFQCTREHDMIYALVGISHDYKSGKRSIEIDYNKTPREVYLEVLRQDRDGWRQGNGEKMMKLAKIMNLEMDESLKSSIFEILEKKIGRNWRFTDSPWG
ncbi:hypothetical protein ACJ41O_000753 [Fusarium nematophilum]